MNSDKPTTLLAFGGNALNLKGHERVHQKEEFIVARRSLERVVDLLEDGHSKIIITHGNGPQVGRIAMQQELTKNEFPRQVTLDVCVADSQGRIGFILQNVFDNICVERGINKKASTVITQVVVDVDDPAFSNPTKPIGVYYDEKRAKSLQVERGWLMKEEPTKGWRRVVPSPKPLEIVEKSAFVELLKLNFIAIGVGGGGIPVIRNERGELRGVEAVIDKDRSSALLAKTIGVDNFVILTEASSVYLDFLGPNKRPIGEIRVSLLEKYLKEGHFPAGSMGPKVEAAIDFVKSGGKRAIISNLFDISAALAGRVGTQVLPD
jgi:carbamate kinase